MTNEPTLFLSHSRWADGENAADRECAGEVVRDRTVLMPTHGFAFVCTRSVLDPSLLLVSRASRSAVAPFLPRDAVHARYMACL